MPACDLKLKGETRPEGVGPGRAGRESADTHGDHHSTPVGPARPPLQEAPLLLPRGTSGPGHARSLAGAGWREEHGAHPAAHPGSAPVAPAHRAPRRRRRLSPRDSLARGDFRGGARPPPPRPARSRTLHARPCGGGGGGAMASSSGNMFKRMAEFGPDSGGRVKVSARRAPPPHGGSTRALGRAAQWAGARTRTPSRDALPASVRKFLGEGSCVSRIQLVRKHLT